MEGARSVRNVLFAIAAAGSAVIPALAPAEPLTTAIAPAPAVLWVPGAATTVSTPCAPACPPGAVVESEVDCTDGYVDATNGGCNFTPSVFHDLPCSDTALSVCGRYGTFTGANGLDARDTDWYRIVLVHPGTLTVCGCADGHLQLLILEADRGCPVTDLDIVAARSTLDPDDEICVSAALPPGPYFIWAGAAHFNGVACGSNYVLTVTGHSCPTVGVEPARWSGVKSLYLR